VLWGARITFSGEAHKTVATPLAAGTTVFFGDGAGLTRGLRRHFLGNTTLSFSCCSFPRRCSGSPALYRIRPPTFCQHSPVSSSDSQSDNKKKEYNKNIN